MSIDLSSMGAAQFQLEDEAEGTSALKVEASERVASHRARRARALSLQLPGLEVAQNPQPETRAARIAAAVAERYAQSPSYRAFLAAEAEHAIERAEATAAVAARTAQAVVAAQQQLLSELAEWTPPADISAPAVAGLYAPSSQHHTPAALTVRLYEEVGRGLDSGTRNAMPHEMPSEEDRLALEDEIEFRQAPVFDETREPAVPLPVNLIEFPRQLVAARKARPRLAEGPLREDIFSTPATAQLRIFEVEPAQISPDAWGESQPSLPEWTTIRLSACAVTEPASDAAPLPVSGYRANLYVAPFSLRLMSAVVDGCLIAASFLAFISAAARVAGQVPGGQQGLLTAAGSLATLTLLYYLLFFTLSDATPGMRYARIGLCTFSDDNPTRAAMRRRLVAILLAACPLGLGLLWGWLDEEGLGWHDRLSRMYQRSY